MAFPQIADADTKNGTVTSNSTSWTLTYPTNIAAGDLMLAFLGTDGGQGPVAGTPSFPAGWVFGRFSNDSVRSACSLVAGKYKAVGGETGTFSVTLPASESGGWRVFRITAASWEGTLGDRWSTTSASGSVTGSVSSEGSTQNNGATANPDPLTCSPDWGADDNLWMVIASVDTSRTFSAFPTNYTDTSSDVSGGAGGASLGIARRNLNAASENPGTFTISASDDWWASTIAIRPAAAAAPSQVPYRNPMPQLIAQ